MVGFLYCLSYLMNNRQKKIIKKKKKPKTKKKKEKKNSYSWILSLGLVRSVFSSM